MMVYWQGCLLVVGMRAMLGEFLDKRNVFAVVGVSRDPEKYCNKVYCDLKSGGYTVFAINPKIDEIMGDRCFHKPAPEAHGLSRG